MDLYRQYGDVVLHSEKYMVDFDLSKTNDLIDRQSQILAAAKLIDDSLSKCFIKGHCSYEDITAVEGASVAANSTLSNKKLAGPTAGAADTSPLQQEIDAVRKTLDPLQQPLTTNTIIERAPITTAYSLAATDDIAWANSSNKIEVIDSSSLASTLPISGVEWYYLFLALKPFNQGEIVPKNFIFVPGTANLRPGMTKD